MAQPYVSSRPLAVVLDVKDPHSYLAKDPTYALAGVFETPAYLVDGEVFLGRAHLPMVRWILSNRAGPPPI